MPSPGCLQVTNTADVFSFIELFHQGSTQKQILCLSEEETSVGGKWLSAHSLIETGIEKQANEKILTDTRGQSFTFQCIALYHHWEQLSKRQTWYCKEGRAFLWLGFAQLFRDYSAVQGLSLLEEDRGIITMVWLPFPSCFCLHNAPALWVVSSTWQTICQTARRSVSIWL